MPMTVNEITAAFKAALKEAFIGSRNYYTDMLKAFLDNVWNYGETNTKNLRGWALRFDLSRREFADLCNAYFTVQGGSSRATRYQVEICTTCTHLEHASSFVLARHADGSQTRICSVCATERFFQCANCASYRLHDQKAPLRHHALCLTCWAIVKQYWLVCHGCHREYSLDTGRVRNWTHYGAYWSTHETGNWREVAPDAPGAYFYCSGCRLPEKSKCQPRQPQFEFPALCLGPEEKLQADRIREVTVGGGEVTEQGLVSIRTLVRTKTTGTDIYSSGIDLTEIQTDDFDRRWQNADGNMPKRIAKILLVGRHMKLTEDLMAEIGNLAKQYTSKPGTHRISLTRNINLPRAEFVNDNSCWWSDYWYSRCTLKSLGGLGIRLWTADRRGGDVPVGRAWMIPLAQATGEDRYSYGAWKPDAPLPAPAYIIFNAYDGRTSQDRAELFDFARIIAQMTGKSYRKVAFTAPNMYINGATLGTDTQSKGVLIAEQSVCSVYNKVEIIRVPNQCSCPGHPGAHRR